MWTHARLRFGILSCQALAILFPLSFTNFPISCIHSRIFSASPTLVRVFCYVLVDVNYVVERYLRVIYSV